MQKSRGFYSCFCVFFRLLRIFFVRHGTLSLPLYFRKKTRRIVLERYTGELPSPAFPNKRPPPALPEAVRSVSDRGRLLRGRPPEGRDRAYLERFAFSAATVMQAARATDTAVMTAIYAGYAPVSGLASRRVRSPDGVGGVSSCGRRGGICSSSQVTVHETLKS